MSMVLIFSLIPSNLFPLSHPTIFVECNVFRVHNKATRVANENIYRLNKKQGQYMYRQEAGVRQV